MVEIKIRTRKSKVQLGPYFDNLVHDSMLYGFSVRQRYRNEVEIIRSIFILSLLQVSF